MTADELVELSRELASRETGRPRQSSLKRAASTAYYALFHAIAAECVGRTIGWAFHSSRYWDIVTPLYRALDHSGGKRIFNRLSGDPVMPVELKMVGRAFIKLQEARIQADYDPGPVFTRGEVLALVALAADAIEKLRGLSLETKRELVAHLLGKQR